MHIYGNDSLQTYFQGYSPRARKCSFCKPRSAHPVPCEKNEGLEPARAPSAPAIYGCLHVPRPRRAAGCMYVCVCVTPDITGCYRMLPDVTGCYRMLPDVTGCYRILLAWRPENRADTHVHAQRVVRIMVIDDRNCIAARFCTYMVF
jgi:hypothetical protein